MDNTKYPLNNQTFSSNVHQLHTPAELQKEPLDPCGPGIVRDQGDSPGPERSPLGFVVQRPGPAADSPRTVRPSCLLVLQDFQLEQLARRLVKTVKQVTLISDYINAYYCRSDFWMFNVKN